MSRKRRKEDKMIEVCGQGKRSVQAKFLPFTFVSIFSRSRADALAKVAG